MDDKKSEYTNQSSREEQQHEYENYLKIFYRKRYIPRNVITKYAFATRVGYIPNNANKVNQDSYILIPGVEGPALNYKHLFGVCDGHGSSGHHASGFIKDHLHELIKKYANEKADDKKEALDEHDYENIFEKAFLECDLQLGAQADDES